jgi:phage tail tape-measure protein
MANRRDDKDKARDTNPDPITGKPGAHPIGVGIGTAAGGAAAGAAAGAVAGPVGAVAGAVIGGVAGGLAGKGIAEQVDPTAEDAYWRQEYPSRDYYDENVSYEALAPAYRQGWESRVRYQDREWGDVEPELQKSWESNPSGRDLAWEKARRASRDAWDRIERSMPGDADNDGR